MHNAFLMGMFESVFENVEITEFENMFSQCEFVLIKQLSQSREKHNFTSSYKLHYNNLVMTTFGKWRVIHGTYV